MAATSVLKLKVDDKEYNASLRQATQGMQALEQSLQGAGKTFNQVDKSVVDYVRSIGQMETQSKTAKGRIGEMTSAFVEMSMQYNRMSDEVKQGDAGKALAQSMETLRQRTIEARQELQGLNRQLNDVKTPDVKVGGGGLFDSEGLKGMLQVFGGNMLTKGVGMLTDFGNELADMVQQGIELARQGEGIRIAFERLGRGDILDGLREATHGTVTDIELMKAAVKFNDFKLPIEELGTMLAFAQQKAKDTGQSVDYMVDSIVTGLGRKSLMILDNLGLSASQIKDKMAETGDMTKAVGAIIRDQMSKAGDYVETAADRAAQADVQLKNAMEELGRTFQPLADVGVSAFNSLKISALNLLNTAIKPLINALTYAGALQKEVDNRGGNERIARDVKWISNSSDKNRSYQNILQGYMQEEMKALEAYKEAQKGGKGSIGIYKKEYEAARRMREEFQKAVQPILNPIDVNINTDKATQDIDSLKVKLLELEAQRKKAIEAGDTDLSKNLTKQINQVKADIKALDPKALPTSHTATPQQRAAEKVSTAQNDYDQALEQAALELKAGTITQADAKKKELQALESLWKAIGDARQIYDTDDYKQAQDIAAQKIQELGGDLTKVIEAQQAAQKAARELEQAQKKLADAQREQADALSRGDLKAYNAATQKVTAAQTEVSRLKPAELPVVPQWRREVWDTLPQKVKTELARIGGAEVPVQFSFTKNNLDAFIADLKDRMSRADVGTDLYNSLNAQLADATALGNLIETAVKNGIDVAQFDPQTIWKKIFGENPGDYIDDSVWQEAIGKLNQGISDRGGDKRFTLDTETGGISEDKTEDKTIENMQKVISGLSQVASGLQNVGIQLPEGVQKFLSGAHEVMSVITGVQTILSVFQTSQTAALGLNTTALGLNATAIGFNTTAIAGLTVAMWANTTTNFIPFMQNGGIIPKFANGGVIPKFANGGTIPKFASGGVIPKFASGGAIPKFAGGGIIGKAAVGMAIPGNSLSGDNLRMPVDGGRGVIGVNSGEIILNRAQAGIVADAVSEQEDASPVNIMPYVDGEKIFLGMNNTSKRMGRGEIVTTSTLRRYGLIR